MRLAVLLCQTQSDHLELFLVYCNVTVSTLWVSWNWSYKCRCRDRLMCRLFFLYRFLSISSKYICCYPCFMLSRSLLWSCIWTQIEFVRKINFSATGSQDQSGCMYNIITLTSQRRGKSIQTVLVCINCFFYFCNKLVHMVWFASRVNVFFWLPWTFGPITQLSHRKKTQKTENKNKPVSHGNRRGRHQIFNWP